MPVRQYANSPATTLTASCSGVATTISVASTAGLPISYPYTLILDRGTATEEAVSVTAAAGLDLTVTRGIDSTTAFAHSIGATVAHGITAQDIREANTHVNATSGVHGVTSALVGTTETQALTNKDLTSATNTFPTSLATLTGIQTLTNKTLDLASTSFTNGAWTAWTPTITAGSGTFTTVSGAGRYIVLGKTLMWSLTITITTAGTAAGDAIFPLPVAAQATSNYLGGGREVTATGAILQAYSVVANQGRVTRYDNATTIGSGRTLVLSGAYEIA